MWKCSPFRYIIFSLKYQFRFSQLHEDEHQHDKGKGTKAAFPLLQTKMSYISVSSHLLANGKWATEVNCFAVVKRMYYKSRIVFHGCKDIETELFYCSVHRFVYF